MAIDVCCRGFGNKTQRHFNGDAVIIFSRFKIIAAVESGIADFYPIGILRYFFSIRFTGNQVLFPEAQKVVTVFLFNQILQRPDIGKRRQPLFVKLGNGFFIGDDAAAAQLSLPSS